MKSVRNFIVHTVCLLVCSSNVVRVVKYRRVRWTVLEWEEKEMDSKFYLKEIGINTKNWVDSAQYRDYWRALVNEALNLRVP